MLRVRLLGAWALERVDDATGSAAGIVDLAGPPRLLLAYLALYPGPSRRDVLAARFWPEADPVAGRANLRTAIWGLRRAIGPDALVVSRSAVGLDAATYSGRCPRSARAHRAWRARGGDRAVPRDAAARP